MGGRTGHGDDRATAAPAPPPRGVVREYTETILVCFIFLLFTRAFIFQQSKIPSGSMEDTLLIGDYIMVNRFVFAPTAWDWERKILPVRDIRRGDIIVFKFPGEPEVDYIKRVIGLPGDSVEVRGGSVYINGSKIDEPYVTAAHKENDPNDPYPPEYAIPGRSYPTKVPADAYFCMGDHRNASADSRQWGFVAKELVKGRALLIWWSYSEDAADNRLEGTDQLKAMVSKILHVATRSRWSRCFTLIR